MKSMPGKVYKTADQHFDDFGQYLNNHPDEQDKLNREVLEFSKTQTKSYYDNVSERIIISGIFLKLIGNVFQCGLYKK